MRRFPPDWLPNCLQPGGASVQGSRTKERVNLGRLQLKSRDLFFLILLSLCVVLGGASGARARQTTSDFQTICAAPGVLKCVGFDAVTDIANVIVGNSGVLPGNSASSCPGNNCPTIDTTTAASSG